MMDNYQDSRCLALEKALADETVDPIDLPFWFLEAITDNFSDEQRIGIGGFGSVYKGALRNGMIAVKKLHNKIEIQEQDFHREVACLIDVKHRNIVRLLGYCYETAHKVYQQGGRHVLVDNRNMLFCFEFLSRGSLANCLTGASSGLQWRLHYQIIKGICEGVGYLHQESIIHMDLKPDNILLDDSMVPRITDFGISRRFSENQSKIITENKVGSLGYMAPELLKCGIITLKTDIYSLGVIIIEILMGCKERPNVDEVLASWTDTFDETPKSSQLLEQVKVCAEIGMDCMHDDPNRRPNITDIIRRLNEMDISSVQLGSRFYRTKQASKPMRITASVAQKVDVIWRVCSLDIRDIDVHPTQPWILVGHGNFLSIWYYTRKAKADFSLLDIKGRSKLHSTIDNNARVISVRFIPRKEWCVAGDDRGYITVYTCHTMDYEIKSIKATGSGSVRSLAIHPTRPYLLSACKVDGVIEIWNWEKGWACSRMVETGHGMPCATFNPIDANTFITSHRFDGLLKVWSIKPSARKPITTIRCRKDLLCHVHVFAEVADRNHVVLNIDTIGPQIWDLHTGTYVYTLNCGPRSFTCTAATCHPTLPLIVVGGLVDDDDDHNNNDDDDDDEDYDNYDDDEDDDNYDDDEDDAHGPPGPTICFWNSTNYRLVKILRCTYQHDIIHLGFAGSRRLVIGTRDEIEVLQIDMESLAYQE